MPPPAYRAFASFLEPILSEAHVLEAATRLLERLAEDLARDAAGARTLRLLLFRVDGEARSLDIGLAAPSRDARHIARLIALRLDRLGGVLDAEFGFEAAAVHVLAAEPLSERQAALTMDAASPPPEALPQLIDRLQQRLGAAAVRSLRPHQSHIPERAVRAASSPSPRSSRQVPPPPCGEGSGVGVAQEGSLSHETLPITNEAFLRIFTPPLTPPRQGEGNPRGVCCKVLPACRKLPLPLEGEDGTPRA